MIVRVVLLVLLSLLALQWVNGDLPIHCLNSQVAGKWVFELSSNTFDSSETCGYLQPDQNSQHFTDPKSFQFQIASKMEITLTQPNIATDRNGNTGKWTMVYDEGFEVQIGSYVYFAFSKYKPKKSTSLTSQEVNDYISYCSETMVGWFHDDLRKHWGCWRGHQVTSGSSSSTLRTPKILKPEDPAEMLIRHENVVSPIRHSKTLDNSPFKPNYALVEAINKDTTSTWKAGVHPEFIGKSQKDMARLIGRRNYNKALFDSSNGYSMGPGGLSITTSSPISQDTKYDGLPENFSWRDVNGVNYDSPVRNQGECGSCYAVAAISVFESRLKIKSKGATSLQFSPQEVVSCSRYNQGCDGGYPFLVEKHGEEFGFVPESCFAYEGSNSECRKTCSGAKRYFLSNHTYVGGYYGACNEVVMMKEIYRAGPIVVAFEAPSSLFYYTGGIFTGPPPKSEGKRQNGVNPWEQTNHAVIGVGWGVDPTSKTKYWVLKNTWGPSWGESGYFRIRRGTDECGTESMSSFFDVLLP